MTPIEDGGPAFPRPNMSTIAGMSLRDYLAAAALPTVITHMPWPYDEETPRMCEEHKQSCAAEAYAFADAMIAQRKAA